MVRSAEAHIAVNRFGLGARPGELAAAAPDPRGWLNAQHARPASLESGKLEPSWKVLEGALAILRERRREGPAREPGGALRGLAGYYRPVYLAEAAARTRSAVLTGSGFAERLVHFWSNHFAVSVDKLPVLGLAGAMEREAIRPYVSGRFGDMLLAVERHPAMLLYLDNHLSVGPDSRLARRASRARRPRELGINENLAREILELHTLGVDGGYAQADVTALAEVITGWSIGGSLGPIAGGEPGRFHFRQDFHQPGGKKLLGRSYREDGIAQGEKVLADLAGHRATRRHVATKLARHFIADEPPAPVVDRLVRAWRDSDGWLPAVYEALIDSPEAWAEPLAKYKTPSDFLHSAWRALDVRLPGDRVTAGAFARLGQRIWAPGSPAGWPDRGQDWDGAAGLRQRIELATLMGRRLGHRLEGLALAERALGPALSPGTREAIGRAASREQALTLAIAAPEFQRR